MNTEKTPSTTAHHAPAHLHAWLALSATIALATLTLAGCARADAQPGAPPPPKVTVAEVIARSVTEWDEFTGRLEAVDAVAVRPRVSGYVSGVLLH